MLLVVSVLVIVLFHTPTINTLAELKKSNLSTIQDFKLSLTNIFSPNSGQEVLPVQVRQMLSLLQTHHIASYQLSNQLDLNLLIKQRIVESAWPIKMDKRSPYLLGLVEEIKRTPIWRNCAVIDQREDVTLVYCR